MGGAVSNKRELDANDDDVSAKKAKLDENQLTSYAQLVSMLTEASIKAPRAEQAALMLASQDYDVDLINEMDDHEILRLAGDGMSNGDATRIVVYKRKRARETT